MFLKRIFVFLWLFDLISCDKSFTLVIDTSGSMGVELDQLKVNLGSTIYAAENANIGDYIIVPFRDEGVAETIMTQTARELVTAINRISLDGGHDDDCPENSLTGIERALQISRPHSNIFLFTNAYAKDVNKIRSIENLCRNTRSQVVIFLTGFCTSPSVNVQAYYDVARACSGTVFELNISVLRQVFKFIKELIKVEWTDVVPYDTFTNRKDLSFSVDSFTKSALLAISGNCGSVTFFRNNSRVAFENIMESRYAQVIHLVDAPAGEYTVTFNCRGNVSVSLYKKNQLPVAIGFSTQRPRRMRETSRRPMPGTTNYMFIELMNTFALEHIAIQVFNEDEKKALVLEECVDDHCLANTFIEPDKSFRIWIEGYDKITLKKIIGSTESLIPQVIVIDPRWTPAKAEILEGTSFIVDYGNSATVACKVVGYPKPRVWWEENEKTLSGSGDGVLLEIPSVYISYLTMENVTSNVTVYCKCENSQGQDSQAIDVYAYRPFKFEVLQTPEDQTIEYGSAGKLFCQVSAYPEAEIKWYHNDSLVTDLDGVEILPEENALYIKDMKLNNVGEYKCEVSNDANTVTYTAYITVSGIEAPKVEIENSYINLKLGDQSDIECRVVKGKPEPEITWQYKSERSVDFGSLPVTVVMDEGKLQISSASSEHNGVYKCYASNIKGDHSAEITVNVQYPPIMSNNKTSTLVVKEDDDVVLECNVSASPEPTVWWEMTQDDVIISLDDRHHTDENHIHRFKALGKDSGNYHCIAQNDVGRAKITVTVNVLVKPYIEAPRSSSIDVRVGDDVTLPCNLVVGNPVPSVKWQFIALDSTSTVLKRNDSSNSLHIPSVRPADEGWYTCIADNTVGTDYIKIHVNVH